MNYRDLFDWSLYSDMVQNGYVSVKQDPTQTLLILNYTHKTQYDGMWNEVTRACRGLILNLETGDVVARPFEKFFNYGQDGAPVWPLDESVVVTDKLDGSLGILYPKGDGTYAVATRGSFTSEQALHATRVWEEKYARRFSPAPGITYLFEIIYPENRVVLDYEGEDDLVLLEEIDTETGEVVRGTPEWPGPSARYFTDIYTLADALALPPRPNAEGLVMRSITGKHFGERVKLKQEDYIELHRLITGLNARLVWEYIRTDTLDVLLETVPDEFHPWVKEVAYAMRTRFKKIKLAAQIQVYRSQTPDRKKFAERVLQYPIPSICFMIYDGKDPSDAIWKMVRPEANITPARTHSEEVT